MHDRRGGPSPGAGGRRPAGSVETTHRLVDVAYAIHQRDAWAAGKAAFMPRALIQATLPHRDPGDVPLFVRRNGDHELALQPGPRNGLPYGSYPRLVLAWLTTEAVRTNSRRVVLGASLNGFMRELGLVPSGGEWGTVGRFRDQVIRLFTARITASRAGEGTYQFQSGEVATDVALWWDPVGPGDLDRPESVAVLGEAFFEEAVRGPVPFDLRVLREIKQSALGIDLYTWLTYRLARMQTSKAPTKPVVLSWNQLHDQFGADMKETKTFARNAKRELARLQVLWPQLRYETPRGRLVLHPGLPHVPRRPGRSPAAASESG